MKLINILSLVAVGALALTSCSKEDVNTPNLKDTPIIINAEVNGSIDSRAGYDNNNLPTNFTMHITQDSVSANSPYNYYNVSMSYFNGSWSANVTVPKMLWKSSTPNAKIIAYNQDFEPTYGEALGTQDQVIYINANQTTSSLIASSDALYYSGKNINPDSNGKISIPFKHLLSKFDITWNYGSEYEGKNISVTAVEVRNASTSSSGIALNGRFNYSTGKGNWSTVNGNATPAANYATAINALVTPTENKAELILTPTTYADGLVIYFTASVNGETKYFSLAIDAKKYNTTLTSNVKYNITATVGHDKVTIGSVTAFSWSSPIDGGNLTTE